MPMRSTSLTGSGSAAVELLLESGAVDELHDQVRHRALVLDGVEGNDVFVGDGGRRPRLAGEPPQGGAAGRHRRSQRLDGHDPVQLFVQGPQHDAHAALADHLQDLVVPEPAERIRPPRRSQEVERDVGDRLVRWCLADIRIVIGTRDRLHRELLWRRRVEEVAGPRM